MVFKRFALLSALVVCSATAVNADEPKTQILASVPGISAYGADPTLQSGIDLIFQARAAREQKTRRDNMQPAAPDRVVRTHKDLDGVMIMGGSSSVPM